jgi:CelD/BcsL family acetyltransferase involved in cellulose biosynthesis
MQTVLASQPIATSAPHKLADDAAGASIAWEPDFNFGSGDFADLFAMSGASAFQHPIWLDAFYRHLAPIRGAEPVIVTGRAASGQLQVVLPMIRRRKSGVWLLEATDLGVSDYAAPVVRNGFMPTEVTRAAIAAALPPHDIMRIRPVRAEHVAKWQSLLDLTARDVDFSAHATDLPASHATWRAQAVEPGFARYLDKKRKRFFKASDARLKLLAEPAEIAAAIGAIQSDRKGRFAGDPIQENFVRDFYAEVATTGSAAGLARTYALMLDGEAIGHVFGLTHGGRFYYLLIGCDYERHGRHSPGLILYDTMIEDWIATGGTVFDFTIGDEAFKADFGTVPTAMFELVQVPTWRGRLASAAFHARAELRRLREARRGTQEQK